MFSGKTYKKTVYLSFSCYFPCLGQNHWSLPAVKRISWINIKQVRTTTYIAISEVVEKSLHIKYKYMFCEIYKNLLTYLWWDSDVLIHQLKLKLMLANQEMVAQVKFHEML